jgi:hypothetical protein
MVNAKTLHGAGEPIQGLAAVDNDRIRRHALSDKHGIASSVSLARRKAIPHSQRAAF